MSFSNRESHVLVAHVYTMRNVSFSCFSRGVNDSFVSYLCNLLSAMVSKSICARLLVDGICYENISISPFTLQVENVRGVAKASHTVYTYRH